MKKRIISAAAAIALIFGTAACLPQDLIPSRAYISATAVVSGDWKYTVLTDGTISLDAYSGSAAKLSIPKTLGGKTVTALGTALFSDNEKLESVTVPSGVKTIGGSAFAGCTKLRSVTLAASVTSLGTTGHGFVFLGCKSLENVTLPKNIKVLESGLFRGCESLKNLTVPSGVTTISSAVFSGCRSITQISIPSSVTSIDDHAFDECPLLASFKVDDANPNYCTSDEILCNKSKTRLIRCPEAKTSVSIRSSFVEIGPAAFNGCENLTALTIPSTVSNIGDMAFVGCSKLKSIYVNSANKNYSAFDGILFNKDRTLLVCCPGGKTTGLEIEPSVKQIGCGAFYGCTNLKSITFPGNVKVIGEFAFAHTALTALLIPENVTAIKDSAFFSCTDLSDVTLSKGLTSVGSQAFADCKKIKSIFVPNTVTSIASCAFGTYADKDSEGIPVSDFVLYCEGSSAAVNYAKQQGISYQMAAEYCRLAGISRYETAVEISKANYRSADTVVLAYGLNYADALAGVPLANALKAPVLLTAKDAVGDETLAEIKRLGAKKIVILGGEGAIGKTVETTLTKNGISADSIQRIAGSTRFETAVKIAAELEKITGKAPAESFIVYCDSFADALSASTAAAVKKAPILYSAKDGDLNEHTQTYLQSKAKSLKKVYIIGGTGVISDASAQLADAAAGGKKTERLSGANRYKTCVAVNERFKTALTGSQVCIAKGLNFPDALAGGVLAAAHKAPLFLADGSVGDEQKSYLKSRKTDSYIVFGGVGAVPEKLVQSICSV